MKECDSDYLKKHFTQMDLNALEEMTADIITERVDVDDQFCLLALTELCSRLNDVAFKVFCEKHLNKPAAA